MIRKGCVANMEEVSSILKYSGTLTQWRRAVPKTNSGAPVAFGSSSIWDLGFWVPRNLDRS